MAVRIAYDPVAFEVELKSSGRVYEIPANKTILDVLIEASEDPMHDCKRGDLRHLPDNGDRSATLTGR
ncbi:hypothetical protein [Bradyrhizobium retamae]|uniref:Uncharacterized protein n=1 Tax=Bradyrhizobium retamae TaxID=1300035 RepID=A0A0R3MJF6_9BRAD|nr:hypothetical protein [Bradyrhizobium retamae]KRR17989.1 hypothetical protein CQ13_11595 [Bradyrhizobium retamae]